MDKRINVLSDHGKYFLDRKCKVLSTRQFNATKYLYFYDFSRAVN